MGIDERLKSPDVDDLFCAILNLKNNDECYKFFQDLCTVAEIHSLAQRFEVARKLDDGERYGDISKTTGASTATISRVKRSLEYGADGYRLAIDRLKQEKD